MRRSATRACSRIHSAQDLGALVRDYTKWDDQPYSLGHFAQSAVRAYKIAMTPPMGPTLIVANNEIQAHPMGEEQLRVPKLVMTSPPAGDSGAVAEAAKMLVAAERPMIIRGTRATHAERHEAAGGAGRNAAGAGEQSGAHEFPESASAGGHGPAGYQPDVTLCLEVNDLQNETRAARARNAKIISISALALSHKSNIQDFGHYADVDLDIGADAEATLPVLIEACKKLITSDRKTRHAGARQEDGRGARSRLATARSTKLAVGWNASPDQSGAHRGGVVAS